MSEFHHQSRRILRLGLFLILFCGFSGRGAEEVRIVSLAPALTELVFQLGFGGNLVGRSEVCDYPSAVKRVPVAGRFGDPELERTLHLRPTLILANDLIRPGMVKTFEKAGISVVLKQCRNLDDYCAWVELLGTRLNCPDAARKELLRIAKFRSECDAFARTRKSAPKKILWVIWDSPLMAAGRGSLPDSVITMAGAENLAGNVPQEYFKASYEWILAHPPDAIVWTVSSQRLPSLNHPLWKQLEAVKRGRVVARLDADCLQRPGPRLPDGVRALRRALEALP